MRHVPSLFLSAIALTCASAPQSALAQGADITHSDIQDAARYPSTGAPVNGKYGYAWGSHTCNIGNANLAWINGGTPALAMNAYRIYDGRLTQLGLGHAKHGCCVANGSGCGVTCMSGGTGLRAGCRDVYSAGFNGGTSRLGPRSGIEPFSGAFTPIAAGTGDAIWRHVQVNVSDMDPANFPSARYFAEGIYVCNEELPAAKLNNASYRPTNVANTGAAPTYAWTMTGATAIGKPAIYAWREHGLGLNVIDPSVIIVNADVPSEGRFVAAGKVTDLNNGTWRYDYAAFNIDSHRSGGGFSVPIRADAIVTNIGFNAPLYHSGEPYDNAPWSAARLGARVVFTAPAKFEENANTNALRWGTMYNFWFTANVPPAAASGSATLSLFRPGSPASISVNGLPVPTPPVACAADFDGSGTLAVQDIFVFVGAWFNLEPRTDWNGAGGITEQDIFDYLGVWFAGC